jgi:hypothetical protein
MYPSICGISKYCACLLQSFVICDDITASGMYKRCLTNEVAACVNDKVITRRGYVQL